MERALGRRNRAEILGCVQKLQALEMGKNSLRPYGRHYRRVANNANKNNDLCFGMKRRDDVPLIAAQLGEFLPTLSACKSMDTPVTHSCVRPENTTCGLWAVRVPVV
ncbi:hypothetical protein J6590_009304 [Homalodisca vitripennis]|nr:hypothetical protein J6590_009304 [Homalodisca vitripennis]